MSSTLVVQCSPAIRENCRQQLAAVCGGNVGLGRQLEQCVWQWSRNEIPASEFCPSPVPKAVAGTNEKHPPAAAHSVKRGKNKATAPFAAAVAAAAVADPEHPVPVDAHLRYEFKILQLLHNLRLNGAALLVHPCSTLVWLDDQALAVGTPFEHLVKEATEHVQRLQKVLSESMLHVSEPLRHKKTSEALSSAVFLKCRRCKSTDVAFDQKQIRAGDEGMTSFCTCNACGARWKM